MRAATQSSAARCPALLAAVVVPLLLLLPVGCEVRCKYEKRKRKRKKDFNGQNMTCSGTKHVHCANASLMSNALGEERLDINQRKPSMPSLGMQKVPPGSLLKRTCCSCSCDCAASAGALAASAGHCCCCCCCIRQVTCILCLTAITRGCCLSVV